LISLKKLNHILSIDLATMQVRVEAGITIKDLNKQLESYGLSLANQSATAEITLGGALSTASHGTGHTGTFSSFVIEIELMTADGIVHKVSPNSDSHIFNAASVSLGAIGIIYAVTLKCEPLFFVTESLETIEIDPLFAFLF